MFWATFVTMVLVSLGSLQLSTAVPTDPVTTPSMDVLMGCKDYPADIYFLLDCSYSVLPAAFDKQLLEFVTSLIKYLDIHPNATRVGMGVFSDDFHHVLDIGEYPDKETLTRMVRAAPCNGGNTYTGKGIHGMRTHGFREGVVRPNVTKVGVVVTKRRSRRRRHTLEQAMLSREEGIWLFAIGVGNSVDQVELKAMASEPKKDFSFRVASFNALIPLARTLANSTCNLEQPQPDGAVCGQKKRVDAMFVYNAGSMGTQNLDMVKGFVKFMVSEFNMGSGKVRAGVISGSSQGGDILLSQYRRKKDLISALLNQPTCKLSQLLHRLRREGFRESRRNVNKMVIAFVNGAMENHNDVLYEAQLLKHRGVVIHVITLGSNWDRTVVNDMAPSVATITHFGVYSDLSVEKKRKEFLHKFCDGL